MKDLNFIIAKDTEGRRLDLRLYGAIGGERIDGHLLANYIAQAGSDYDTITLHINSEGGSVLHGLSIFNAILTSPAQTIAHIEGVAASMAGIIPLAADKVIMNDFARIMLHNPFIPNQKAKATEKEQRGLDNFSGILTQTMARRGFDQTAAAKILEAETWFTAEQAKEAGLVDEIINTGKRREIETALAQIAATAEITSETYEKIINTKKQDMKLIASMYGLEAVATEAEIVSKIQEDKDNLETLTAKLEALEAKNVELQALADEIKQEREDAKKLEIERITDTVIAAGHFDKDQRDALIEAATASFDTFKKMVDGLKPIPAQSLSATIAQAAATGGDEKRDFEWYRHNDPLALAEMQNTDREKYAKLYAQWEKENI